MKKLMTAIALCGALLLTAAAPVPRAADDLGAMLDKALEDRSIPAMAVLVIRDGKIEGQAVRGVRVLGGADAAMQDDIWHIGSDAKSMTATMIARLVEQGKLSWSAPLKALLPGVAMRPEYQDVTLADLLSHRAGLRDPDDVRDAALIAAAFADPAPLPAQRQAYARTMLAEAPIGPARKDSVYSNSDYVIAGAVAEQATGKSFDTLMQELVFTPLGMTVSFDDSKAGQVLGHKDGKPLTGPRSDNPRLFAPAGRVKITMTDWARYAIDQMAGERGQGKLLSAADYTFLHAAQGETNAALGWGVKTDWPKTAPMRMIMHAGSNGYWYALIALAPDRNSGVLIAANAGEGTGAKAEMVGLLMTLMGRFAAN